MTLRCELKENWVKHRGEVESERKSDTTKLFIDDVPTKLKDYQAYINELIPEDLFKLLTVPGAFNALKVEERRQILMGLVGEVDDTDVIASNSQLSKFTEVLGSHSIADQKKTVTYQRKELRKRLSIIPDLVAEAERAKPELDAPKDQLEALLTEYQQKVSETEEAIKTVKASSDDTERRQQIADLQVQLTEAQNAFRVTVSAKATELRRAVGQAQDDYDAILTQQNGLERAALNAQNSVEDATARRTKLLDTYNAQKVVSFDESATECPTCHQQLPEDQIEELRADFNVKKSSELEELIKRGKEAAAQIGAYTDEETQAQTELRELEPVYTAAQIALQDAQKAQKDYRENAPQFYDTDDYAQLTAQIDELQRADAPADYGKLTELNAKLTTEQAGVDRTRQQLAKYDQVAKQDARKQELIEEETKLK